MLFSKTPFHIKKESRRVQDSVRGPIYHLLMHIVCLWHAHKGILSFIVPCRLFQSSRVRAPLGPDAEETDDDDVNYTMDLVVVLSIDC